MSQLQPQSVDVLGVALHYVEAGSGDPVVFVHGAMSDFRTWGLQMEPFAGRHRAVACSLRYHWPNAWAGDGSDYGHQTHASDVAALIDALGMAPAHVVTSSYGSEVGLLLADQHPEVVRSLVLGEPLLQAWRDAPGESAVLFWEDARRALLAGEKEKGLRLFVEGAIGEGAYDRLPEAMRVRLVDNQRLLTLPAPELSFTTDDAASITTPVLLLTGEWSSPEYLQVTEQLAALLPHAERQQIPSAMHLLHSMNAPTYNDVVLDFLARH